MRSNVVGIRREPLPAIGGAAYISARRCPQWGRVQAYQTPDDDVLAVPLGDRDRLRELRMNFEKYTDRARGFIQAAQS